MSYSNMQVLLYCEKVSEGARRLPWLSEAMKDVISCDKRRVGANILCSGDFRMGHPVWLNAIHPYQVRRLTQGTETS